jgi:hypothetical protein
MKPFGPPAVGSVVIVVVVVERPSGEDPVAMVKIVVGEVAAVEFAAPRAAGKAAAADMTHAMAAKAAAVAAAKMGTA